MKFELILAVDSGDGQITNVPLAQMTRPDVSERKRHAEAAPTVQNSNSDSRSLTAASSNASGSKLPPHHSSSCSWSS